MKCEFSCLCSDVSFDAQQCRSNGIFQICQDKRFAFFKASLHVYEIIKEKKGERQIMSSGSFYSQLRMKESRSIHFFSIRFNKFH
jgi:hypothetical protein